MAATATPAMTKTRQSCQPPSCAPVSMYWCGYPCVTEQEARHPLVHRPLDGPGVVVNRNTQLPQGVQHVEAQHHLLQRSSRNTAHEDTVRHSFLELRDEQPAAAAGQIDPAG